MKSNNNITGPGHLKGRPGEKYYKLWAEYLVKFLDEYKAHGIDVWGITTGNEPVNGLLAPLATFNNMGFTPYTQRDFIKLDLGPTLNASGYGPEQLKVIIMDDQRIWLPFWSQIVLGDPDAAKYVAGTGEVCSQSSQQQQIDVCWNVQVSIGTSTKLRHLSYLT